jgi:hypothetical protein
MSIGACFGARLSRRLKNTEEEQIPSTSAALGVSVVQITLRSMDIAPVAAIDHTNDWGAISPVEERIDELEPPRCS